MPPPKPPTIAIVAGVQTPYRLHVHRRFAREIPEVRLHSLFTHDVPDSPWKLAADPEINPVMFGPGEIGDDRHKPARALHEWRKGGRICRWLAEHDARLVVAGGYGDPAQLRIIRWCRANRVPCFIWADSNLRGDTAAGLKRIVKNLVVSGVVSRVSGCMVFGSMGREYFRRYGAPSNKVFFVPFEPDYALFTDSGPADVAEARQRYGLATGRRRIVFSGRLVELKRVDLAIDAFARIAAERPEWDLVICGSGPLMDDLKARVPEPLRARVKFLGFIAEQRTLGAIYHACDLMVLTSNREAWSLVINEGAAAGLALVVSSVVGAAPELVCEGPDGGANGLTFQSESLDALSTALLTVTDPGRIDAAKAASRAVIAAWRSRADPVQGFRRVMASVGVLPATDPAPVAAAPAGVGGVQAP